MTTNYEAMTDAELSEAVAVKCAGWTKLDCRGEDEEGPQFATSADAVLPLLEKFQWVDISREHEEVAISLTREKISRIYASAPTLARAACLALLKAKDAEL